MKKTERGITLIALVVTIVVLLILAAVSISMLGGENGIITQAIQAKEQTIIGEEKEVISVSYTACKTKDYSKDVISAEEMQTEIDKIKSNVQVTMSGSDLIIFFKDTEHFYSVNQNGQIIAESGDPNRIVDMIDFNIGVTASGKVIYIENNAQNNLEALSKISIENYKIVTENGVRKVGNQIFIDNEGKVYIWEDINFGCSMPVCISDLENDLKGKNIADIYLENNTIIALDNEGKVYTWGSNSYGKLGDGSDEHQRNIPICISNLENDLKGKNIVEIYLSYVWSTIVALDSEGKVYTWGYNKYGQIGDGSDVEYRNTPICISDLENDLKGKNIVDIYSNGDIIRALDDKGKIYAWGDNWNGQIGDGSDVEYRNTPICISDLENDLNGKNIVDIYSDSNSGIIIALDNKGKVYTWGDNWNGILGNGSDVEYRNTPICISDLENDLKGKNIVDIYLSYNTIIALDSEGKVYTWGSNWNGILGDGSDVEYRNTPICISNLENDLKGKNIVDIYMKNDLNYTIIALDSEGKVYTWGENSNGILGDGNDVEYRNTPICISNLENDLKGKNIVEIYIYSYSGETIIAKDEDGKIYIWGSNNNWQLGEESDVEYINIPICINSQKDGKLKNKDIYKCCLHSYGYTYITQEGEAYYYYFRNSE